MNTVITNPAIKTTFLCFPRVGHKGDREKILGLAQNAGITPFAFSKRASMFHASGAKDLYMACVKVGPQHVVAGITEFPKVSLQNYPKDRLVANFGVGGLDLNVRSHIPLVSMVGQGEMVARLITILYQGRMGVPQFLGDEGRGVLLPGGGNWMARFGDNGRFGVAHMVAGFPAGNQSVLIVPTIIDGKVVVHVLRRDECNSTVLGEDEYSSRLTAPPESRLQLWGCS